MVMPSLAETSSPCLLVFYVSHCCAEEAEKTKALKNPLDVGLSVRVPLKAAMTGIEILVERAQLWEQSAAKHVSIAAELASLEALARRWRKSELSSWQSLLAQAMARHATGTSAVFKGNMIARLLGSV